MPATAPNPNKGKAADGPKFRFVKCDLTQVQRDALRYWRENDADYKPMLEWVNAQIARGHTLSVKAQEVNYNANLTGVREASGHMDQCLTGYGSTPENAMFALWYKDVEVLKGTWPVTDRTADVDL